MLMLVYCLCSLFVPPLLDSSEVGPFQRIKRMGSRLSFTPNPGVCAEIIEYDRAFLYYLAQVLYCR